MTFSPLHFSSSHLFESSGRPKDCGMTNKETGEPFYPTPKNVSDDFTRVITDLKINPETETIKLYEDPNTKNAPEKIYIMEIDTQGGGERALTEKINSLPNKGHNDGYQKHATTPEDLTYRGRVTGIENGFTVAGLQKVKPPEFQTVEAANNRTAEMSPE